MLSAPPRPFAIIADKRSAVHTASFSLLASIDIRLGVKSGLFIVLLTSRCLQIKLFDQEAEDEVIQEEVHDADRNDQQPARLVIALQDTKQQQIEETAGEGQTDRDVEHVGDHIGRTGQDHLYDKQHRRNEQEGELDRFR